MNNFAIITDSSCDLSHQMVLEHDLTVLPLSVLMEEKSYFNYSDNSEITPQDFYAKLRDGVMASTNAVNVGQAEEAMTKLCQEGKDVLVLGFSSGLSTTYNSFAIAADTLREQFPDRKIYTVDTLSAAAGQGLLVYLACKLKEEGKSMEEVRDWVEANKLRCCHWVTVNDLMHLKRGGRVSAATAMVGSLLSVKPMIAVTDEGKLETVSKARGRKTALDQIVAKVVAQGDVKTVFIGHADCLEDANYVADQLTAKLGELEIVIGFIGPVIGAHTGPGCLVAAYLGDHR